MRDCSKGDYKKYQESSFTPIGKSSFANPEDAGTTNVETN
jgi:hypothetical protein